MPENKDLSAEQIRDSLLLLLIIISLHRGFNLLFSWKLEVPHSACFTAVTTEVTPGQDTSLSHIIATGPQSGHLRHASVVADELESKGGAPALSWPRQQGGKDKRYPQSPTQRTLLLRPFVKYGQRLRFTAVPASNKRNSSILILNCIAKLLIN